MLSARSLLLRQLQQFFETDLVGLYSWFNVRHRQGEKNPKEKGRRQTDMERVYVDFGDYSISVSTPDHAPPLGEILLYNAVSGETTKGPLDASTWASIGEKIRTSPSHHLKDKIDVDY